MIPFLSGDGITIFISSVLQEYEKTLTITGKIINNLVLYRRLNVYTQNYKFNDHFWSMVLESHKIQIIIIIWYGKKIIS